MSKLKFLFSLERSGSESEMSRNRYIGAASVEDGVCVLRKGQTWCYAGQSRDLSGPAPNKRRRGQNLKSLS